MVLRRYHSFANVNRIVGVPLAERMRMGSVRGHKGLVARLDHILDLEIAKNSVVAFAGLLFGEQTEKQKDIANPDALIAEVRLSCARLAEQAPAFDEHGVFVT